MKLCRLLPAVLLLAALLSPAPRTSAEEVYLIRGGFNVFSLGMDEMASQLRAKGVNASVHGISAWRGIANGIVRRSKRKQVSYPIVFLGHSLGADAAPEFARYLGQHGITVDLVIGFDPTGRRVFTGGARRVINYQSSARGPYVKGAGFRGTVSNINVSRSGANHFNIEQKSSVQQMAMREVLATVKSKRRR